MPIGSENAFFYLQVVPHFQAMHCCWNIDGHCTFFIICFPLWWWGKHFLATLFQNVPQFHETWLYQFISRVNCRTELFLISDVQRKLIKALHRWISYVHGHLILPRFPLYQYWEQLHIELLNKFCCTVIQMMHPKGIEHRQYLILSRRETNCRQDVELDICCAFVRGGKKSILIRTARADSYIMCLRCNFHYFSCWQECCPSFA